MENFKVVIFLMTMLLSLSAIAHKIKLPYPILLVAAGIIMGFTPFFPRLTLNPEIIFLIFLPPLLYDAAFKTSWHDFRGSIRPISTLAVILVFFTTTTVAITAHYIIPGFSWPLAFVLGAIVSPSDAVATTSVTKALGLNKKVVTILEGESLVNDASALIAYRYALATVSTGVFMFWKASLEFLQLVVGGAGIGITVGYFLVLIFKKIYHNPIIGATLSLLTPFVSYLTAEYFHTSGVFSVVCTGLFVSWRSLEVFSSATRTKTKTIWDMIIFSLNGFIFILIGLQLPEIIHGTKDYATSKLIQYSLMVSMATIGIRISWVYIWPFCQKLLGTKRKENDFYNQQDESLWSNVLIVAWTGTRGVISLATALALPLSLNGKLFVQRPLIVFLAFVVIFMTLIAQGLSLPFLLRFLKTKRHQFTHETTELLLFLTNQVIKFIDNDFPIELENSLQEQIKAHYVSLSEELSKKIYDFDRAAEKKVALALPPLSQLIAAQIEISRFKRLLLIEMHKKNSFNNDAIQKVEEELDIEDSRLNALLQKASYKNKKFV